MTRVAWYGSVLRAAIDFRDAAGPQPRGWTRYARDLGAALRQRTDIELVAPDGAGWRGPEALWEQIGFPRAARGCDLLHAPNVFLPLRRPCPGVVTIHDLAFEDHPEDFAPLTLRKFRWLAPRAARSAERVICVSAFTARDVVVRYGIDEEKVRVVHNAPSLPIGSEPPPEREPYVLGVGDLRAKKNWQRLIDASPLPVVIAGIDAGERLRGAELTGWVDDARLDALMRGAAAVVHPSLYEGYGLVVAEALARGVRVAAAGNTALPEAGGDQAQYFDPLDLDDMRAAIERALAGPPPERVIRNWAEVAEETVAVYREAAACA
jgi:glycosyltransferase involved in cell wall biosynthesis